MKLLKRIVLAFLFLSLLITGTLLVISFAYENEVKEYMIRQLNNNLKTKVIVDIKNIQLSLFKNFPFASLSFRNVTMLESPIGYEDARSDSNKSGKKFLMQDTLFLVEDISLQFNILDILQKKYIIKKVAAENGKVNLRIGIDGSQNWDVWKRRGDTTSSDEESFFDLNKFNLENISFQYHDLKNKNDIFCVIHGGSIGGRFTNKKYDLSIKGDLFVRHFKLDAINYFDSKPVKMDFLLQVDNDKNQYEFSDVIMYVADLKISVQGKYITNDKSDYVAVFLKGKDMDVQSVLSLLPEKYHSYISDYDSDGEFYFNAHINGKMDDMDYPEIKADFGITKADITQLSSGIALKDVHVIGNYFFSFSSSKRFLDLKTFSASLVNGKIRGSIRIDNFSDPNIRVLLNGHLLLEDVRHLLKTDTIWNYPIESFVGSMKVNMEYKGRINKSGKYALSDFENMVLSGDVVLDNAGIKIKNSALAFDSINGSFGLQDNTVTVHSLSWKTTKSDFYLKGVLKDVLAYSFSDDADINVDAIFQSNHLDLNEFLLNQRETSQRDTVYKIHFSPRLNFVLNSDIGHLTFRKFDATNVRGMFQLHNQKLIGDPISFSTMDGSVIASGMIDGRNDSMLLFSCDANLKKLNISKLFYQFEDFNQTIITHTNLKGIGTADVQFASVWKSDLTVDINRVYVRSNMTIEKGELMRFEPMQALSKYIEVSELEDIKFSTMQNQIEIKGQKIFIPKMDVRSSALDVTLSGMHSFDNEIDYHVKVLMSDILFRKARKAKKENDEFGIVEEDKEGKTSLFLSMTGTVDNPIIKYDRQGAKQSLKENIAREKQTIKQILKEEFHWLRKDTAVNKKKEPKESQKFIIKWEEEEKDKKNEEDDF